MPNWDLVWVLSGISKKKKQMSSLPSAFFVFTSLEKRLDFEVDSPTPIAAMLKMCCFGNILGLRSICWWKIPKILKNEMFLLIQFNTMDYGDVHCTLYIHRMCMWFLSTDFPHCGVDQASCANCLLIPTIYGANWVIAPSVEHRTFPCKIFQSLMVQKSGIHQLRER